MESEENLWRKVLDKLAEQSNRGQDKTREIRLVQIFAFSQ